MLKPLLLLPAVVLIALGVASNPTGAPQEASKTSKPANGPSPRAKEIYNIDCALCHGPNGNGKTDLAKDMQLTIGDFTDPKTLQGKSDEELFDLIRKGKDKMPGEDPGRAKNDDVKGIILYLRSFSKDQPSPAPAPAPAAPATTTPGSN